MGVKISSGGHALTAGIRKDIERQAKIGGGISRSQAALLFSHIDTIQELLETVISDGWSWDDEQWSVFIDAALPLLDGWTIRTSKKLGFPKLRSVNE
jgi:hypothetical protein